MNKEQKFDYFMAWCTAGMMRFGSFAMLGCYVDQGVYHRLPYDCWPKALFLVLAAATWTLGSLQEAKISIFVNELQRMNDREEKK